MAKLTPKQKTFANEYLIDLNATKAYLRAGYKVSESVAAVNGSKLLRNTKVQEYLQKRQKELEKRTEITQERVLKELAAIAFANSTNYIKIEKSGEAFAVKLIPTDEIPEEKKAAIISIKESQSGIEVKLADKTKALELLGRHLGMFTDKVEHSGSVDTGSHELATILEQLQRDDDTGQEQESSDSG